jgi:hypothetical protein
MSFLNQIVAQRIAAEDKKLPERIAEVNSVRLAKIIEFFMTIIAGIKAGVPEVTEAVMKFLELGGLAVENGEDIFKKLFTSRPDLFYAYDLPRLWAALKDRVDLQDHVAGIYYQRACSYAGPAEHFHWAVKAILNILTAAGAPPADVKFVVNEIIATNKDLLLNKEQSQVWLSLNAVRETGEYRRSGNHSVPTIADKSKVVPMKGAPVPRQKHFGPADGHNKMRPPKATKHTIPPATSRTSQHEDLATQLKEAVGR